MARRRPATVWVLLLVFVVMPLIEIYVIIQVGQTIGAWWTVALLVVDSVVGTWLVRREGGRAWQALRNALHRGAMPARELADGGLILIGGTLMIAPGFVTDLIGITMIVPITRPFFRRLLTGVVARRLVVLPDLGGSGRDQGPRPAPRDDVVRGEVVEDP